MKPPQKIFIAVTGASGSIYAETLVQELLPRVERLYLSASETGKKVLHYELGKKDQSFSLRRAFSNRLNESEKKIIRVFNEDDFFAPCASGTASPDQMVVLPCSMGSLARIATGVSSSLIERTADVMLKQRKNLILCPRETPLNSIHLRNMLTLSDMGAHIIPATPGFYQKPRCIQDLVDFVVGRVLESLGFDHKLYAPWAEQRI